MASSKNASEEIPLLQQMLTKNNVNYQDDDGFVVIGDDGNEIDTSEKYHDCYQDELSFENGSVLMYKIQELTKIAEANDGNVGKATNRLINEIHELFDSDAFRSGLFSFKLGDDNDLYEWWVKVYKVEKNDLQHNDLKTLRKKNKIDHMLFTFCFSEQYPYEPPTVRLVSQELFDNRSRGVKKVCDKLLTRKTWSPALSMTSIITEIAKCPKQKQEKPVGEVILSRFLEYATNDGKQAFITCVWMVLVTSCISMVISFYNWYSN